MNAVTALIVESATARQKVPPELLEETGFRVVGTARTTFEATHIIWREDYPQVLLVDGELDFSTRGQALVDDLPSHYRPVVIALTDNPAICADLRAPKGEGFKEGLRAALEKAHWFATNPKALDKARRKVDQPVVAQSGVGGEVD